MRQQSPFVEPVVKSCASGRLRSFVTSMKLRTGWETKERRDAWRFEALVSLRAELCSQRRQDALFRGVREAETRSCVQS